MNFLTMRSPARWGGGLLLGFWLLSATLAQAAPAGSREAVELRRVGVSRVGGQTLVTVVLSRPAAAKITPTAVGGKPQLVVEFPQVKAGRLPAVVAGDDQLVSRARTEVGPGGAGVKITLDLFANRPYTWWRHSRSMSGNQTLFVVGLKGEGPHQESTSPAAPPAAAPAAPRAAAPPAPARAQMLPPSAPPEPDLPEEPDNALPPSGPPAAYPETTRPAPTGTFSEVRQLIPQAGGVLQYLEGSGWRIASAKDYDRPGVRYSRAFTLTNSAYPELAVNIVHLPANAVGTPNINLIELSFGNLKSSQAEKYRQMRTWSFAKIKQNFEDIGDFFDDAMKPLRVELRKDCQRLALRYESLIQAYVQRLCPHHPKAAEQVVNHIKAKVSPRFEGVQYTISENPLLILNLVDFLYLRAYFVGGG